VSRHRALQGNIRLYDIVGAGQSQRFTGGDCAVSVRHEVDFARVLGIQIGQEIQQSSAGPPSALIA
jgi:hypothetical protein